MECYNCFATSSPQWRNINEQIYCNACGIYFKRKKIHRDVVNVYAKILMNLK